MTKDGSWGNFVADEWSPGYSVSTTNRTKGLPPARGDPNATWAGQQRASYLNTLTSSRAMMVEATCDEQLGHDDIDIHG